MTRRAFLEGLLAAGAAVAALMVPFRSKERPELKGELDVQWLRAACPKGERFSRAQICYRLPDGSLVGDTLPVFYDKNRWFVKPFSNVEIGGRWPPGDS